MINVTFVDPLSVSQYKEFPDTKSLVEWLESLAWWEWNLYCQGGGDPSLEYLNIVSTFPNGTTQSLNVYSIESLKEAK